jgi:hypothetical protein
MHFKQFGTADCNLHKLALKGFERLGPEYFRRAGGE